MEAYDKEEDLFDNIIKTFKSVHCWLKGFVDNEKNTENQMYPLDICLMGNKCRRFVQLSDLFKRNVKYKSAGCRQHKLEQTRL